MKDFTLQIYKELLLTILQNGYSTFTFEEYCKVKPDGKYVVLRHDVDLRPDFSLAMAQLENKLHIQSTYYFRIVRESNQPAYIQAIAALGHEIGYHYEDLNLAKGDFDIAYKNYQKNLEYFRTFYPVGTVAMHGSPREKHDNRDLWKKYDYHSFDIIGEPYFDFLNREDVLYFTDTGRMWDGDKYNVRDKALQTSTVSAQIKLPRIHTTSDLIEWIKDGNNQYPIMISTHPQRWTDDAFAWWKERIAQAVKNQVKAIIRK